jgi:3-isopropylmalate/(R)-2-methylmalate dehydratase large subunit
MSIECGARAGLIAPDEVTYRYLKGRKFAPADRLWAAAVSRWQNFLGDSDCSYDKEVLVDLDRLGPMITWGTNPGQALQIHERIPKLTNLSPEQQSTARRALEYTQLSEDAPIEGVKVDWAFIGSCTNGRIEDLRIAADVLRGKKVAEHVTMYVVPGSEAVMRQAQQEGLDKVFTAAGAVFRMPGCSMCLGMNDDKVPAGKRCISSSNRNFVGRQGPGSITHLASPATVAASAIEGAISSSDKYLC